MEKELANYIKYCLGYVRLTRERTVAAQQRYSVELPSKFFELGSLLNGDSDGKLGELINLETFYKYDPKEVPEDELEQYEEEKAFANKIEDIYNKHRNDQFTKQVVFNFGYFEVELPIESNDTVDLEAEEEDEPQPPKTKIDRYPLFALPVRIEKEITKAGVGRYYIYSVDPDVQVNIGMLEPILGEDLYFQLLEEMGKYEVDSRFTIPILDLKLFTEIWRKVKAQLRLKKASFDEDSFSLEEIKIALSPKSNYFLAEDLAKLSKLSEDDLSKTSLTSWVDDKDLNVPGDTPADDELYFPFLYDKYQLATLSLLGNKTAIIQGPPGTGKSETISNILCHLAASGKRVLFVSQKAQALKVVKDKLKKLDVKYLYGYLPNPNSAQIGEEDEADGIAPQLSGLGAHIEKMGYSGGLRDGSIIEPVARKTRNKEALNALIEAQRRYYKLHQELLSLQEYDLEISDLECFAGTFSSAIWHDIKDAKSEIDTLGKVIRKYERSDERKKLDALFSTIDLNGKNYAVEIGHIKEDVDKTGYDRHSRLFRALNNTRRNMRLNGARAKLPREIVDYVDTILKSNTSRNEASKSLAELHTHCLYYENAIKLERAEKTLAEKFSICGVSDEEFEVIDSKIDEAGTRELETVKSNILRVQELKAELQELASAESTNKLGAAIKRAENERTKQVALYLENIVNGNILSKWKRGVTIRQIIQKLARAFGKSKRAFKTFDNLRKDPDNFNAILDLIPIWIMELDDASRIIPLEAGIFDYVILDEASQCNIAYTLPVMYRAQHTLFVGDSEQMRDSTIMFKSNRVFDELARRYGVPDERQIKATGNAVQSVLDIAKNRGFMYKTLHYHYRSPMELINFSNKHFYKPNGKDLIPLNSNYLTYKDTNRVMLVHEIQSDWVEEISDQVNVAEAKAILELFKEMRSDERYRHKSIGILSFFNAQATYIRTLFNEAGYKEEEDDYKVSIIEGIQGDEKDIVIYSFVIRDPAQKKRYMPLTGEGGDIRGDINKGRVNVAFSRARQQVHCFVSLPPKEMPEKIWLKKYLEYVEDNGEVSFNSSELKPFDSYFEEEFYNLIRGSFKRGYKIQNQVESCGFKIDFVISNAATGKRLAIECDGPHHFKDEIDEAYGIHIESDEERQRVLEAAGWEFCRIKYSDWVDDKFDRDIVTQTIKEKLK